MLLWSAKKKEISMWNQTKEKLLFLWLALKRDESIAAHKYHLKFMAFQYKREKSSLMSKEIFSSLSRDWSQKSISLTAERRK